MVVPDRIQIVPETAQSHHAQLTSGAQNVPASDVIAIIHGDGADPISEEFLTRLHTAATLIGGHTDLVRAAVTQNADALKRAATDLMGVEGEGADQFHEVSSIVAATSADTTKSDLAAAAASKLNDGQVQGGTVAHGDGTGH